ncbi:hypothetical protein ISCGN_029139 [Ixodes scapularis]
MLLHVAILAVGRRNANEKMRVAPPNASVAAVVASQCLAAEAPVDCHTGQRPAAEPSRTRVCHIHHSCWDAARIAPSAHMIKARIGGLYSMIKHDPSTTSLGENRGTTILDEVNTPAGDAFQC